MENLILLDCNLPKGISAHLSEFKGNEKLTQEDLSLGYCNLSKI